MDQPGFDNWTIVFLFFSVFGILAAATIFVSYRDKKAVKFICLLVALFSITITDWVLIWTKYQYYFPWFMFFSFLFTWLYGPLYFFYMNALQQKGLTMVQKIIHLLPFFSLLIIYSPAIFTGLAERQKFILDGGFSQSSFYFHFTQISAAASIIHILAYSVAGIISVKKYYGLKIIKQWALLISVSFFLVALNFLVYYILTRFLFFSRTWDYGITFSMIALMAVTTLLAYIQPSVFNGFSVRETLLPVSSGNANGVYTETSVQPETEAGLVNETLASPVFDDTDSGRREVKNFNTTEEDTVEENIITGNQEQPASPVQGISPAKYSTGLPAELSKKMAEKLSRIMEDEKLYAEFDMRLNFLAQKLNLSRNQASQVINEQFGMNFFEYINHLRIEEAKRLLQITDKPAKSIKEITYEAGFNNKVSFYKFFKANTGLTPNEYRNQYLKQGKRI